MRTKSILGEAVIMKKTNLKLVILVIFSLCVSEAWAYSIFHNEADFLAAAPGLNSEGVEGLVPTNSLDVVEELVLMDFVLRQSNPGAAWASLTTFDMSSGGRFATEGTQYVSWRAGTSNSSLIIEFNTPVSAFGFTMTDGLDVTGTITLSTNSGDVETVLSGIFPDGHVNFFGIVANQEFLTVTITDTGTLDTVGLDGFFYGTRVPEPTTPPVADADGSYTIYVGDTLTLDASGSTDVDGDIVSYLWDLDDDEIFETDATGQAVFTVDYAYLESLELLINHQYTIGLKVTDSEDQSDTADSTLTIVPKPAVKVAVDIKPGGCPNPVNVKSSGVLPVAVLGSGDYDITTIDPTSIRLAGVEPLRSGYEDVAGPFDSNDCNCVEAGPDGLPDLTLKFETQGIVKAIGDVNDGDVLTLELTGVLYDPIPYETPIEGADCILIRGKYKAHNKADINKDGVVDMTDFAIISENWLQSSIVDN